MSTIFTKIIKGEIPSHKILEDENYYSFLDINPMTEGHVLVVPKQETDYIFDLEDETLGGIMIFAKKIAQAVRKTVPCERVGVMVLGMEVPHAHIHLIPLNKELDMNLSNPRLKFSQEEFTRIAEKIRSNII